MQDHPPSSPAGSVRTTPRSRLDAPIDLLITELTERVRTGEQASSPNLERLLGVLAAEIVSRRSSHDRYSPQASAVHLSNLLGHPDVTRPALPELRGATCLDFGSGGLSPLGGLFTLLLAGAQKGIALDLDNVQSLPCATQALYHVLCAALTGTLRPAVPGPADQIISRVSTFNITRLSNGDPSGIDATRLQYMRTPLADAALDDGSIDLLFSNSVLEHVLDVESVLAEMARIIRPGGLAVHAIDGYDHRYYQQPNSINPHAFLFDDSGARMLHGCNRIRPLQFAPLFELAGFEIRKIDEANHVPISDAEFARLAPPFRELPRRHIEVARARYYLRRK